MLVCHLLSFASGASINALATSLLAIQRAFSANNETLGRVQLLFFLGGSLLVVAGGWFTERLGEKFAAVTAMACLAMGAAVVGWAPSLPWVFGSALLLGFGCTWASVSYSVIVARHYPTRQQSMFSLVSLSQTAAAIVQPIAFGAWFARVERGSAHAWLAVFYGLASISVLGLLIIALAWKTGSHLPTHEATTEEAKATVSHGFLRQVIVSSAMWLIGLCVLMHGIFQIGYTSWIGPYHASRISITPAEAALFVSVNNVGFFAGRSLLGWLCVRVRIPDLVLLGSASGLGSLMIFLGLLARDYKLALALCLLEGFFVAGNSPAMSAFVGSHFAKQASVAFAIYTGVGQAGAAAGGYLVGFLARFWNNIQQPIWLVPITSIILSLLAFTWNAMIKRSSRRTVVAASRSNPTKARF